MIGTILMLVTTLLPVIFAGIGVPPVVGTLIGSLGAALPGLITSLTAGKGPTDEVLTVLAALQTEIAALSNSKTLTPDKLLLAASLDHALQAALAGYQAAETTTDPTTLTDLPEAIIAGS
jgi:hypothetical protein